MVDFHIGWRGLGLSSLYIILQPRYEYSGRRPANRGEPPSRCLHTLAYLIHGLAHSPIRACCDDLISFFRLFNSIHDLLTANIAHTTWRRLVFQGFSERTRTSYSAYCSRGFRFIIGKIEGIRITQTRDRRDIKIRGPIIRIGRRN